VARATLAVFVLGPCLAPRAHAHLAYDNFLPDGSFFRVGWSVLHTPLPGSFSIEQAESFVAWHSGTATRVTVALGHAHGANRATLELRADEAGRVGRRVGRPCPVQTNPNSVGLPGAAASAPLAGLGWHLKAGRKYWLLAKGVRSSVHAWQVNLSGAHGLRYVMDTREAFPWYGPGTQGTFRIELAPFAGQFG
jgi:hypothetical protein